MKKMDRLLPDMNVGLLSPGSTGIKNGKTEVKGWGMRVSAILTVVCCVVAAKAGFAAEAYTINDAIKEAVRTNPGVGEAAANRRATDAEMRQSQGVLLPQVRMEASAGPEKLTRFITPEPTSNGDWNRGRQMSVVVRQLVFDGFSSINEIWRQAARVDAAAYRVHERTELIALDAAEAYIDVVRYTRLVALAQDNIGSHNRLFSNVKARFSGGRAGEGDLQQGQERLAAAEATLLEFKRSLEDARAKYRKVVGLEAFNLRFPGRLPALPKSRDESLAVALRFNPTIRAAGADVAAAKYGFHATAGSFVPQVSLEGRALRGEDSVTYDGYRNEVSGKVVLSWDIFRGGQDSWKRVEASERMIEQTMREARLQREAFESLDKAWAARTLTAERAAALSRDVVAARKVVVAYGKEYELGQRTLIDLLNAENQYFNSSVSLVSSRGVAVFADYQMLAVMGHLLQYLKTDHPMESEPLDAPSLFVVPLKVPPILIQAPGPGPEPLQVAAVETDGAVAAEPRAIIRFGERWPTQPSAMTAAVMNLWLAEQGQRSLPQTQTAQADQPSGSTTTPRWHGSDMLSFAPQGLSLRWPIKTAAN